MKRAGFLLLEALVAAVVLSLSFVSVSQTFRQQTLGGRVLVDYEKAFCLAREKLFDLEKALKAWEAGENPEFPEGRESAASKEQPFFFKTEIREHPKLQNLWILKANVTGLAGGRSFSLQSWVHARKKKGS